MLQIDHAALLADAALILVVAGLIALTLAIRASRGANRRSLDAPDPADTAIGDTLWVVAAAASVGGAVIHFALASEHIREIGVLGWGFVVAGFLQGGVALLATRRRTDSLARLTVALNIGLIGAWLWSRTVGLPVGPGSWQPETIGRADLGAVALEALGSALLVAWLVARRSGRSENRTFLTSLAVIPSVGLVAIVTILALSGGADGAPHAAMLLPLASRAQLHDPEARFRTWLALGDRLSEDLAV